MQLTKSLILLAFSLFITDQTYAQCIGGQYMTTTEGDTVASFCVNQDGDQSIVINPGKTGTPFAYILTDANGIIQRIQLRPYFDFSNSDPGTCFIYGISFAGILNKRATGEHIYSVKLASICFEFAANRIRIEKGSAEGGEVSFSDGSIAKAVCAQDGQPDLLSFQTSSSDSSYVYIITDEDGDIEDVVDQEYDFDQNGPSETYVYGLSYSGMLLAGSGMNIHDDELADGCYALSDNAARVLRTFVDGGIVTTENGKQKVFTCIGDGIADSIFFSNTSSSPAEYIYVITDEENIVRGFTMAGADFEAPIPGISYVYGLSYAGDLLLEAGDTVGVKTPVDGCFDWSENTVEIIQDVPDGGMVSTADGSMSIYTCPGDGMPDVYLFESTDASNSQYAFVFTDENGVVLEVLGGNNIDFEHYPSGMGMIYGIAYTGDFLLQEGDTIDMQPLSSECYELSENAVEVNREMPEGGTLSFQGGGDSLELCKGDGISNYESILTVNTSQTPYIYVMADTAGNILDTISGDSIDFEDTPNGTARVYGLAYTGELQFEIGDPVDSTQFSDDCYDLSDNYLEISPLDIFAGIVRSEFGDSLAYVCAEDTSLDIVSLLNTSNTSHQYAYVFMDGSEVEAIVHSDTLHLDDLEEGMYIMRGIAYIGDLNFDIGDTIPQNAATSCYDWSENEVEFHYGRPEVGDITTSGGDHVIELCSNDDDQTIHLERQGGTPTDFLFILTDADDIILGLVYGDTISMKTAPPGTYKLYGITGSPLSDFNLGLPLEPDTLDQSLCLDVSDTVITVIKTEIKGGTIGYADGSSLKYFCSGDTMADRLVLTHTGEVGDQYAYLCLDEHNVIRAGSMNDTIDVSALMPGQYTIVGVSYNGTLLPGIGDTLGNPPLSTECHALSENSLPLIGLVPDGGNVQTSQGEVEVEVVVGDGEPDPFTFQSIGASNTPYVYVVTDSTDKILAILPDSTVDFENVPPGENRVYGIAYTGSLLINGGENIFLEPLSDDCFDVSDNAVIFHLLPDTSGILGGETEDMESISATVLSGDQSIEIRFENELDKQTDGILRVFDLSGRLLHRSSVRLSGGANSLHIPMQVERGMHVYFIQLLLEDGRSWTRKIIPFGKQ